MEGGKSSNTFWQRALLINPYYFAFLLLGMFAMNLFHVFSLEKAWSFSPIYFLGVAFLQSLLEVLFLIFIGNIIKTYLPKGFYLGYVSVCFLVFTLHYIDLTLLRYMDISVYYGLHWIFDETLENFIELLHITGISIGYWIFILCATLILIPAFAMTLYFLTEKLAAKKRVKMTHKGLFKLLCSLPLGLIALDMTMTPKIERQEYHTYQRMLPWKGTVFGKKEMVLEMGRALKELPDEEETLKKIHSVPLMAVKKPNIYLFIAESLREDFIDRIAAKHLTAFKEENLSFKKTFSNANATQISWYSIFHSNVPFHWAEAKKKWKSGSAALQILKKMGYKIHVYSAAQLKYYGLDDVMFGKNHYLADSYHVFPHYYPTQSHESDEKAIATFMKDIGRKKAKEGNVFVFFLESTHFNYSWPDHYPVHFSPISEEKTHLRVSNSLKNIELIKNRYRNSIHFMDSLFGKVTETLKEKGLYDEGVIIFTGDHGEEFFEEGQLFHASHLSTMQTKPPIYMKLGDNVRAKEGGVEKEMVSHVDIFPTVLDHLLGGEYFSVFDGESIYKEKRKGYVISGRFNGPRMPEEFFISNGEEKCTFKMRGRNKVEVRSFERENGEKRHFDPSHIRERFHLPLTHLFK